MDYLRPCHYNYVIDSEDDDFQALTPPSGYSSPGNPLRGNLARHPTVKISCRANPNYSLSIRNASVVLAPTNPKDMHQHWIKDMRFSSKVKDEEGHPAFALVNKGTGEAMKHSFGPSHPVRLVPYNPDYLDESVLWTESRDVGRGFRCIRMVNNINLNFEALHGDNLVLGKWCKGDNQSWKMIPYCEFFMACMHARNLI